MKNKTRLHQPVLRVLIALALSLAALAPGSAAPRAARAAGSFVVDTFLDAPDTSVGDPNCVSTLGGCSLRAAIEQASWDLLPTIITFDPGLNNVPIVLSDTLGTILWTGDTITVTGGPYAITVSGSSLTGSQSLIRITGSSNTLQNVTLSGAPGNGVEVGDFNFSSNGNDNLLTNLVVIGSVGDGIYVRGGGGGGFGNVVYNNYIGLTNIFALGCAGGEGNRNGVVVRLSAQDTQISSNWIGCGSANGVSINGLGGTPIGTVLYNNKIGNNTAGAAVPNTRAGVSVQAGARDVFITSNMISGNTEDGVYIADAATGQVTVTANYIGLNDSLLALGNGRHGLFVTQVLSAALQVGLNFISGNGESGISILDSGGVTVTDNYIGIDTLGLTAMPNGGDGVTLSGLASHNLIGGTQAAGLNTIGGNLGSGVRLDGADVTLNQVSGNFIGTNGPAAIPNAGSGVTFDNGAHHNLLGGAALAARGNVISGNTGDGVDFENGAHDNTVDGNLIGLNAAGTGALGNGQSGVALVGSPVNIIGSAAAVTSQFISGNTLDGIYVSGSTSTFIGPKNVIGAALVGSAPLGNGGDGIWLKGASGAHVEALAIVNNALAGVAVTGNAVNNKIVFTENHSNGGLPIDLNTDGATPNDLGDPDIGPNDLLNYPVLTAQAGSVVSGTACSNCVVFVYKASGNPAAAGGGGTYVGQAVANGAGVWTYTGLPAGVHATDLSLAACEGPCTLTGNTSEMSPRFRLVLPLVLR